MIIALTLHNSGGSDEGTAATLATVFWAASVEMGKPLSPKQLGCGSLSESLLHSWEIRYAAQCFVGKCHRMRQQGVQYVHFSGDHGRIKGQDSLVKGWRYAAWDKNGNRFVDFLCSDIDKCGHSAEEVVVGIKKAFQRIKMLVPLEKMCFF